MRQRTQFNTSMRFAGAFAALLMNFGVAQAEVSITDHATENMTCSAGVCSPTAKRAYLSIRDLQKLLKRSDITVTTGSGAVTMGVDAPLSWTSKSRLTLNAIYNVAIKAPLTVAGPGALTIVYNSAGTDGDLKFFPGGHIDFWDLSSNLVVNGGTYVLAGDITTLAADLAAHPDGSYALATDYDASLDGRYRRAPIEALTGTFEGLGHTISKLSVGPRIRGNFALFGVNNGVIRDVTIRDANITAGGYKGYAGTIAGHNYGTIHDVHASGQVTNNSNGGTAGGLAGYNGGIIENSSSTASVLGAGYGVGGLVGINTGNANTVIRNSYAAGSVSGGIYAGGLVGYSLDDALVERSFAAGDVSGAGAATGGLVGYNLRATIADAYASGSANHDHAGGLVGTNDHGAVFYAYSTGAVGGLSTGGLIGIDTSDAGSLNDTYWDTDTSGISNPSQGAGNIANDPGITGLTDAQLKSALPAGFDPAIWGQSPTINNGYPYLLANPPPQ
jgi:hypothetical protein